MAPIRCCFDQTAVWHSDAARGPSTPSFDHLVGAGERRSIERQSRPVLIVVQSSEIIFGIDLPCPGEEILFERLTGARTQRVNDATEGDLDGKSFGTLDRYELKMIWECPHPEGNEVILRKSNVRVTAGDHFRHIAMGNAEAARKVLDLVCKERVSGGLADQRFDRSAITGTSSGLH